MENWAERVEALERDVEGLRCQRRAANAQIRLWRGIAAALAVCGLCAPRLRPATAQGTGSPPPTIDQRVATLEAQVTDLYGRIFPLAEKLPRVSVSPDGNDITIARANLRIVNGSGHTNQVVADSVTGEGLGNLIIGYDETGHNPSGQIPGGHFASDPGDRKTGSHNLVLGMMNNYTSWGGLVLGVQNEISAPYASITAGDNSAASGVGASVSGGTENHAEGVSSSISGGAFCLTIGPGSHICGGKDNRTFQDDSHDTSWTSILGGTRHLGDLNHPYQTASN